ncbi:MAG: hypothetical protein KDJ44_09150 [Rhodoblastus sp.]|nr:hypothetical protein [Rhodoblastus sp.]
MKPLAINVVSDEEAEKAAFVICVRWTVPAVFADDEQGTCCACGAAVRFRPHAPKKPPRICMECIVEKLERSQ